MLIECYTAFLKCPGKPAGSRIKDRGSGIENQALELEAFLYTFFKFNIVTDALLINQEQHLEINCICAQNVKQQKFDSKRNSIVSL